MAAFDACVHSVCVCVLCLFAAYTHQASVSVYERVYTELMHGYECLSSLDLVSRLNDRQTLDDDDDDVDDGSLPIQNE